MKLARWGLVATVVLGAVMTSGCNTMPKIVTSTTYDHWMTLDAYTKKQGDAITAYIQDAESQEAARKALATQLEDLKSKTSDNAQMLEAYKTARDKMAVRLEGTEAERKKAADRVKAFEEEVAKLNQRIKELSGGSIDPKLGALPEGTRLTREPGRVGIQIENTMLFSSGSATLNAKGIAIIGEVAKMPSIQNPAFLLSVEGHTDSDKVKASKIHFKDNFDLSAERARSVMMALAKAGVDIKRMQIVGHGPNKLVIENGKENKAKSRRVEIFFMRPMVAPVAE